MCTFLYSQNIYLYILIVYTNLYLITGWKTEAKSTQELDVNLIHVPSDPSLRCLHLGLLLVIYLTLCYQTLSFHFVCKMTSQVDKQNSPSVPNLLMQRAALPLLLPKAEQVRKLVVNLANALRLPRKKEMTIWSLEQDADMLVALITAMLMAWTQIEKDFGVVQRLREQSGFGWDNTTGKVTMISWWSISKYCCYGYRIFSYIYVILYLKLPRLV
jgi:hypothetical protein